jgi:hypothetical protein
VVTEVDGAAPLRETVASASSREESAWSSTDEREAHRDEMDHSIPAPIAPAAAAKGWARRRRLRIWGTGFASFKNFGQGAWAKSRFLHKIGLGASYGFRAEWCRPIPVKAIYNGVLQKDLFSKLQDTVAPVTLQR